VRYVLAVLAALFVMGLVFDVAPFEVVATWAVVALLVASAIMGSRSGNREQALKRTIFINDSLIGYMESVFDEADRRS
jgi:hypothetical protein